MIIVAFYQGDEDGTDEVLERQAVNFDFQFANH
jgi:hypothetical protein